MAEAAQFQAILEELRLTRQEVGKVRNIQEEMKLSDGTINTKLDDLQKKLGPVCKTLQVHGNEIKDLKREKFRKRLIIFGIPSVSNEAINVLEGKILTLIKETLGQSDFSLSEVDFCKRLGSRMSTNKPILLGLTTERRKQQIFRNSKVLKDLEISIRDDLPPEVRAVRKDLLEKMKKLRAEGKYAIVRFDQLIVREDQNEGQAKTSSGQKRGPSQSPEVVRHNKKYNSIVTYEENENLRSSFTSSDQSMHETGNNEHMSIELHETSSNEDGGKQPKND